MPPNSPATLCAAFEKFAETCRSSTDRPYVFGNEQAFEELEKFVAIALSAYGQVVNKWDPQSQVVIRRILANRNLQGFLDRTKVIEKIRSGEFDSLQAAIDFEREVSREHCQLIQRFVLDGLELNSPEIKFRRGRIFKLTKSVYKDTFGTEPSKYDDQLDRFILELHWRSPIPHPPWDNWLSERSESEHERIHRMSYPWVTFINLWGQGKVRVSGAYEWTDSTLLRSPKRFLEVAEPIWKENFKYNPERDVEEWESREPRRTLTIDDGSKFVRFLERLDDGLQISIAQDHRADIAMRYFRRVIGNYWTHHLDGNKTSQDHNEDIIVDAVTALESILLANEKKGKGSIMAARAAAILEETDGARRQVRKRILKLYKIRSAILHGDIRPTAEELTNAATDAEEFSRRCLAAFLLANSDRESILLASNDTAAAEKVRRKAKL